MLKTQGILKKQLNTFTENLKKLCTSKLFMIYLALMVLISFALFFEETVLVLFVVVAVLAYVLSFSEVVGILLFLYPFNSVFIFKNINFYFGLFSFTIFILSLKYLVEVIQKKKTFDWFFVAVVVAYLIFLILPIRETADGKLKTGCDIINLCSVLAFFVMLYLVYKYKEEINFVKCLHLFLVGFLIAGCLGWFAYCSARLQNVMSLIIYHGIDLIRYNGLFKVPNTLAIVGVFASSSVFYLQYKGKIGNVGYVYNTLIFAICYITLARSFLYAYLGGLVLFIIAEIIKEKKNSWKIILPEVAGVLFVALVLFMYTKAHFGRVTVDDLVNGYNNSVDAEDITAIADPGRGGLTKIYVKDFLSSILVVLFGRGISAPWIGGTSKLSSHNTYLQCFWNTGVIGVVLFVAVMLIIIKKYSALNWKSLIKSVFTDFGNYILILPILALMLIENLFMNMQMIIAVMLVVFAICAVKIIIKNNDKIEEKTNETEKIEQ